jgi:hypothetical protein
VGEWSGEFGVEHLDASIRMGDDEPGSWIRATATTSSLVRYLVPLLRLCRIGRMTRPSLTLTSPKNLTHESWFVLHGFGVGSHGHPFWEIKAHYTSIVIFVFRFF